MTRKVETCNESETVSSLMERMTSDKFRNVDAEPRDGRHHVGARAVAHRCCVQQRVARRNRVDLGGIGVARGRENAVREQCFTDGLPSALLRSAAPSRRCRPKWLNHLWQGFG